MKTIFSSFLLNLNLKLFSGLIGVKRIVVIPRKDKTEHIHDQFQLIRKLDSIGCVIGVFDERLLPNGVEKARNFHFCKIERGNAEKLIREKLEKWFL